jgi:hypothetical protein
VRHRHGADLQPLDRLPERQSLHRPAAALRQGRHQAKLPRAPGLILDAAGGLAEGCGGCAPALVVIPSNLSRTTSP